MISLCACCQMNDLLIWKTIQWACEQGFWKYSLGGAHPFLRKWEGTIVPIYRYRLDRTFLRRHDFREDLSRQPGLSSATCPWGSRLRSAEPCGNLSDLEPPRF